MRKEHAEEVEASGAASESFTEEGDLVWNEDLVEKKEELGKLSKGGGAGGQENDLAIPRGNLTG